MRLGIEAQLTGLTHRVGQQLAGQVGGQLVGRDIVGDIGAIALGVLDIGAVATHAHIDRVVDVTDREGRQATGIDVTQVVDQLVEALTTVGRQALLCRDTIAVAPVELVEHVQALHVPLGDLVEITLHRGGELVVDQLREVLLQQARHREGQPGRNQGRALLEHIVTGGDRAQDRGIGRRTTDLELLELRHQARLGVTGRGTRLVAGSVQRVGAQVLALRQVRQLRLGVVRAGLGIVIALDIGLEEAVEGDRAAAGHEAGLRHLIETAGRRVDLDRAARCSIDLDRQAAALRVGHLGRDGAHPDQLVQAELLATKPRLGGRTEGLARGTDRLVGLLRVLDLGRVHTRLVGHVLPAEELLGLRTRRIDGLARQLHRVGTHVGDETALVQLLGHAHRRLRAHAELAAGLLLHRRGAEGRVGLAGVGTRLDRRDGELRVLEALRDGLRGRLVQRHGALGDQRTSGVEVTAGGDAGTIEGGQTRREVTGVGLGAGVEDRLEVPVGRGAEGDALTLTVDDQTGGDRLHTARRQLRHDLLPQHGADLVAVETVKDSTRLLGIDQVEVEIARVLERGGDRLLGDLVEDHPLGRDLRLELLQQVPRDRLALAVTVGGQEELVGVLQFVLELAHDGLLVGLHDVEWLEVIVDVDTGTRPLLALVLGGDLGRAGRQVAHVTDGGVDHIAVTQVALDLRHLVGRLDDHQAAGG